MTERVKDAVAILKRSRKLKWSEADVRAFARELARLGESGLLKAWFTGDQSPANDATSRQLDKQLAGLSRQVSAEKSRLIRMMADYLRERRLVNSAFPDAMALSSGPRFFGALCAEIGNDRAVRSYADFESEVRQKSSRKYKF